MRTNSLTRVEVINTGTELLFGSILNLHLSYLGQQLFSLGFRVQRQSTVPDGNAIGDAILEASARCDLILVTGGLGPTNDDVTREVIAELTERPLYYDDTIFQKIKERFDKRGIRLTAHIIRQAYVPQGAIVLPNDWGTAPGLYLPAQGHFSHLFLFPGPPRELYPMFKNYASPILRNLAGRHDLYARVFLVAGLGESYVEDMVGKELESIPGLEIGYCARMGEVDLRIIGSRSAVEQEHNKENNPADLREQSQNHKRRNQQQPRRELARRALRHFERLGALRLAEATTATEALAFFNAMKELHCASWERRNRPHSFSGGFFEPFHRPLIGRSFAEGGTQLLKACAGDRVLGYLYNFRLGNRVYAYQSGFDDSDRRERPGIVTHFLGIRHAFRSGARVYDFMAGRNRLKESFATWCEPMLWQVLQQPRLAFRLEHFARQFKQALTMRPARGA